jgi:beta-N-acetylhexosaminidase|tara:strand:+ start:170 stop:1126 length:957 start_codon:yes stop_codon:yes gene_type:complete
MPDEIKLIKSPCIGGVILFSRNFESRKQLIRLIKEIRKLRPEILICVDQEGGRVQRFLEDFTRIPPMQNLGNLLGTPSESFIKDCGWLMACELISSGIDFSFAPVLDLDQNTCEVIADRSFSENPQITLIAAGLFIEGMKEAGMASTGKHFPGHGGVDIDSHIATPIDNRSIEDLYAHDLIPFARLVDSLDAIMPAHIIYPKIDKNAVGFSKIWIQKILRRDLNFGGVIFSDDLSMKGADVAGGFINKANSALTAGCDVILVCNNRKGVLEVIDYLESSSWTTPSRLSKMRHRKRLSWGQLITNDRWISTKAFLESIP